MAGRTIVESGLIHGLSHNYPGADTEGNYTDPAGPDMTGAAFAFFQANARS